MKPNITHLLAIFLVSLFILPAAALAKPPIVAAASDLQFALSDIAKAFTADTGKRVRLNFGSSGNFRRQIAQGAPFELYLSADEDYVHALHREGHTLDAGALYAIGRVAIIAPRNNSELLDDSLTGLRQLLAANKLDRFAIANPDHAPYGVAARQVLESLDLWEAIEPHLILGENVSQAAQYALSGETAGGIVAYSLALAPPLSKRSEFVLLPAKYHQPLRQRMALLKGADDTARAFYKFLQGKQARTIFNRYGFMLPEEIVNN